MFESLDFPAPDVDGAIEYYVSTLGGELVWKVRHGGTVVANVRVSRAGPALLLASHLEGTVRMILRRRFGSNARDVFVATRFRLTTTHDSSDNHAWFTPEAVSDASGTWRKRRRITSMVDPTVPRGLGTYLARAGGIPFEDRTTKGARDADFPAMREQLEKSGPLGRLAVRFLVHAQRGKRN